MKEFFEVIVFGFFVLFLLYLGTRLISSAYYKSKQNFLEWYHRAKEERKNDA